MKTKAVLTDADVSKILAASKAHANKNNWAVTIAIVDDGGHLLGLQRLDGAAAMSAHIAPAKAHTSARSDRPAKDQPPQAVGSSPPPTSAHPTTPEPTCAVPTCAVPT